MRRAFGLGLTAAMLAAAAVGATMAGCGDRSSPSGAGGKDGGRKFTICLLPKKRGQSYYTACSKGAAEAARELDVELIYDGPTDGSPQRQAELIEKWIFRGVDVIAVAPSDPAVVASAMIKARQRQTVVITWDSDSLKETREFFINPATDQEIGQTLMDALARDLGGDSASGGVAIITSTLTAALQNAWIRHVQQRLPQYPALKMVAVKPCSDDPKLALQAAQDLIKAHPDLRGLLALSPVALPPAAEAVRQARKSGAILVTGLATPNDCRQYIQDGTVRSALLWNAADLGYLTVQAGYALAAGRLKPGARSFAAGRLAERPVQGDNVLLGRLLVLTRDNIDQYDF